MERSSGGAERRLNPRFKVKDGAYAALSPNSSIMGQIVDIGRGGLCFRYIVQSDQASESDETHIFVGDNGFYLEKMPFTIVEDNLVDKGGSFIPIMMRQRRVHFSKLTPNQLAQLDYFLENRTTGQA